MSSYHPPILRVTTLVGSNFEKRLAFHNSQKQISRDELVKIKHEDFTLDINNIMNVYSKDNASNFVYLDKLTTWLSWEWLIKWRWWWQLWRDWGDCLLRAEASRYFTITIKHQPWLGLAALPGHGKSRTEELSGDNRSGPRKWLGARMTGTNKQITGSSQGQGGCRQLLRVPTLRSGLSGLWSAWIIVTLRDSYHDSMITISRAQLCTVWILDLEAYFLIRLYKDSKSRLKFQRQVFLFFLLRETKGE